MKAHDIGFLVLGHISVTVPVAEVLRETISEVSRSSTSKVLCCDSQPSKEELEDFKKNTITKSIVLCVNLKEDSWESSLKQSLKVVAQFREYKFHVILMGEQLSTTEFTEEVEKIKNCLDGPSTDSVFQISPQDSKAEMKSRLTAILNSTRLETGLGRLGFMF